jgi:hypothetical protein
MKNRLELESFKERQVKLEKILRTFSRSESQSTSAIPYSDLIPEISRWLILQTQEATPTVDRWTAKKKLEALKLAANEMEIQLKFDLSLAVKFPLEERLAIARIARSKVDPIGRPGRPRKDAARRVAIFLAQNFEALTGAAPGRITLVRDGMAKRSSGPFIHLLGEVYRVLEIEASTDYQAKAAIHALEKNGSNP